MSNLFLVLVIAFVVIVLAIACLAIGWLITGKKNRCILNKGQDGNTSSNCDLSRPKEANPIHK